MLLSELSLFIVVSTAYKLNDSVYKENERSQCNNSNNGVDNLLLDLGNKRFKFSHIGIIAEDRTQGCGLSTAATNY